jgi:peptide/nickel transport system substrate-binding protein
VANRLGRACLLLAFALSWAGCGGGKAPEGQHGAAGSGGTADGDTLVVPISSDPATLNFVTGTDVWQAMVARFVADSLVDEGADLQVVPRLASSWDLSSDGKILVFHLRTGVRWHDGVPFSSKDVLFTYRKYLDPSTHARADLLQDIQEVTAPDDATLRVVYRTPTVLALDAWKFPIVPEHLLSEGDFMTSPEHQAPVGTGPFRFVSWERGREIVMEANHGYFLGRPHLDRIVLKIIPSPATQIQSLLTGDTDWASIPPQEWEVRRKDEEFRRRFETLEFPVLYLYYIAWNEKTPFFADARVRSAMTLSLDRSGYLEKAYHGAGVVAATTFHPRQFGFDPSLRPLPFDPEAAGRLLDEAGWLRDPSDGVRRKGGRPFRFEILIFQDPLHEQIASLLQESLSRNGVRMEIRVLDFPALLDRLHRHDYQAALSGWILTPDPDPASFFHSNPALGSSNYVGYSSPEMDRLLEEGRHTFAPEARRSVYQRVQALLHRDQPYTFLFFPLQRVALDRRFHGVQASAGSPLRAYPGVVRWYVPAEMQKHRGLP